VAEIDILRKVHGVANIGGTSFWPRKYWWVLLATNGNEGSTKGQMVWLHLQPGFVSCLVWS